MIRPRISVLVAFTLSLAACPNDRLVVSNGDNVDGGGGASGAGQVTEPGSTGGAGAQGTADAAATGGATVATASDGASGGDTAAPPISIPVGTAGANGGASSPPVTPDTGTGGQVVATAGVTTNLGGTGPAGSSGGSTGGTGGTSVSSGNGGSANIDIMREGPCDIYRAANMPCAAAYSMIRVLSKNYQGPLFQVRAGSSSTNNTMWGGTTKDIMPGPDGFVDSATVDEACGIGYCTVSVLYDHSGNENHIKRAQKGSTLGGATGGIDNYESIATKGKVKAGGHTVYSLYMNKVEAYRSTIPGTNMPRGTQPQGTYELADGTRKASACCWNFGNVTAYPATEFAFSDAINLGHTWWGNSKDANWYGFGIDFGDGVWTGGSKPGDVGWGALDNIGPANTLNPSMHAAKFALGFIRVSQSEYAIRVADLSIATELKEAWRGGLPVSTMNHRGGIVLGAGADNSNNSFGTFYEGAMVAGYPTNDLEAKIMANIKGVGYAPAQ